MWLSDSYKLRPGGAQGTLTDLLAAAAAGAAVLGAVQLLRTRALALAGWVALSLAGWLVVSASVTTWASAKALMLTTPVVMLLAWGGVAALSRGRAPKLLATAFAAALIVGVIASDVMQYRSSNLAPTARYEQLASLDHRFKGQGPALFTDFDEYALYELRDLDIGGPDFVYPPAALASLAGGYGREVDLERASPRTLARYPLIITRRDPLHGRPPVAYVEVAQDHYYDVFRRSPGAEVALAHVPLSGAAASQCRAIGALARGRREGATLAAAPSLRIVPVRLAGASRPARWGHQRAGFAMSVAGTLRASFRLPSAGLWRLWVQGQFMPPISFAIDGSPLATVAGDLSGNSIVSDTLQLHQVPLAAGSHSLAVHRSSPGLRPGGRGSAVLDRAFLTLGSEGVWPAIVRAPAAGWRALCGRRYDWVELLPSARG